MKRRYIIECTPEQLDDLKTVIDYVVDTEFDSYEEWLQESANEEENYCHIYALAINASKIEYKEIV